MSDRLRILFAGETAIVQTIEMKGYDFFSGIRFGEAWVVMEKVLSGLGHEVTHIPCHLVPTKFPRAQEDLAGFDVVIFSDIGSNTFLLLPEMVRTGKRLPNLLKLVRNYVESGGGFCMIGGYMTFQGMEGKGKWKGSILEPVLPVDMIFGDDRVEVPDGVDLRCNPGDHEILGGLPAEWPYILGYNQTIAKPGAKVLIKAEEDPLLAVHEYGKGRAAAYTTDCAPHWAPAAMHEWEYYPLFWDNLLKWLAHRS